MVSADAQMVADDALAISLSLVVITSFFNPLNPPLPNLLPSPLFDGQKYQLKERVFVDWGPMPMQCMCGPSVGGREGTRGHSANTFVRRRPSLLLLL